MEYSITQQEIQYLMQQGNIESLALVPKISLDPGLMHAAEESLIQKCYLYLRSNGTVPAASIGALLSVWKKMRFVFFDMSCMNQPFGYYILTDRSDTMLITKDNDTYRINAKPYSRQKMNAFFDVLADLRDLPEDATVSNAFMLMLNHEDSLKLEAAYQQFRDVSSVNTFGIDSDKLNRYFSVMSSSEIPSRALTVIDSQTDHSAIVCFKKLENAVYASKYFVCQDKLEYVVFMCEKKREVIDLLYI